MVDVVICLKVTSCDETVCTELAGKQLVRLQFDSPKEFYKVISIITVFNVSENLAEINLLVMYTTHMKKLKRQAMYV